MNEAKLHKLNQAYQLREEVRELLALCERLDYELSSQSTEKAMATRAEIRQNTQMATDNITRATRLELENE